LFSEPDAFKMQMDAFVRRVRALQPLDGFDQALMPGGIEVQRERQYRTEGVPVGPAHRQRLDELATALGMPLPW
jgi:LDH2 family malate/lactate/ureidoglycolate dehydrogenase